MWSPLLEPGRLALISGPRSTLRGFHQELAHHVLHTRPGHVLWCDGDHGFNPYDFAELNLTRGFDADTGDDRLLVKRCMTPFQWDTVLTKHLDPMLRSVDADLVLAAPYDALFSTDELKDWEQEDYVAYSLRHLAGLARDHHVPILLSVDMPRWWTTHPILARMTHEAVEARWTITRLHQRWRAVRLGQELLPPVAERQRNIDDYLEAEMEAEPVPLIQAPRPPARPRRVY